MAAGRTIESGDKSIHDRNDLNLNFTGYDSPHLYSSVASAESKDVGFHSNIVSIDSLSFSSRRYIFNGNLDPNDGASFFFTSTDDKALYSGKWHDTSVGARKDGNTISTASEIDFLDIERFAPIRMFSWAGASIDAYKNIINIHSIKNVSIFEGISIFDRHDSYLEDPGHQYVVIRENTINLSGSTKVNQRIAGISIDLEGANYWGAEVWIENNKISFSNLKDAGGVYGIYSKWEDFEVSGAQMWKLHSNDNELTLSNSNVNKVVTAYLGDITFGYFTTESNNDRSYSVENNVLRINNSTVSGNAAAIYVLEPDKDNHISTFPISNNNVYLTDSTVEGGVFGTTSNISSTATEADGIDADNQITATGINHVGFLAGFKTLNLVADNRNHSEGGVDGSKAVITLTAPNTNLDLTNRELTLSPASADLSDTGIYNLIHVAGENSSLTVKSGTWITYNDTFKQTAWKLVSDNNSDLKYEKDETLAICFDDESCGQTSGGDDEKDPDVGPGDKPGDNPNDNEGNNPPIIKPSEQKPTDNAKTLAENYLGSAALISLGTEYIADEGLAMIVDSAKLPGKNVFGAIYGGTGKYHTGSRLDLDSATLITGISAMTEKQKLAISAFVEAGWGDSEGHVNQAHAKADHNVYSFGTAMRFFTDSPWYFDASARLGVARFDYTGNFATESVKFDHSGIYAALHGAVGYAYPITEDTTLDSYLRYAFTYLEGGSEKLHNRAQDTFKMDSIRASAFRIGTRVKGHLGQNQYLNYRVGAAYEKVVDGDANTKIDGMSIDAPSLNGDTGILEIGLAKRPTVNSPWGVDVTLKGYAGDRDGLYGSATVNYIF